MEENQPKFNFQDTTATKKVFDMDKRIRAVAGGTAASKTISILVWLIDYCQQKYSKTKIVSIVSESHPHLEKGAILDFQNIMRDRGYWKQELWHDTKHTYTFETGNKLEFYSVDSYGKAHGPRRDVLFINECNNLDYKIVDQLIVRTREIVWLDWNPSEEFWFYTEMKPNRSDIDFITLTYKDNEALDKITIEEIESHKNNKAWWTVYGLGQLGEIETRIYTGWRIIDEIPYGAELKRYGLDFGYSNDPSALVAVYNYNGEFILDEILYQKGMSNKHIADTILAQPDKALTIADSAEPKSIDEIRLYGVNIAATIKGPGSVNKRIQLVQGKKISVTKRSVNLIKEYRNYVWTTDRDGKIINEPMDLNNHCFSGDTFIQTTLGKKMIKDLVGKSGYLYSRNGKIERFSNVRSTRKNAEMVTLTFDDGNILSVTPDHLLLQPNGQWIEAQLLNTMDMIQSGMYGANIQWKSLSPIFWREILQSWKEKITQGCMGILQWAYSYRYAYSSQGQQYSEQSYFKPGIKDSAISSFRAYDTRETATSKTMDTIDKSSYKEVASVKRGQSVAYITWEENLGKEKSFGERMCSLSQKIYHQVLWKIRTILWSELQNESPTKTITRISRGFCDITYNLEVENTHCLWANGIIAHNCMDALGYGMNSLNINTDVARQYVPKHTGARRGYQVPK